MRKRRAIPKVVAPGGGFPAQEMLDSIRGMLGIEQGDTSSQPHRVAAPEAKPGIFDIINLFGGLLEEGLNIPIRNK